MNSKDTVVEEFIQDALRTIKDSNASQHIVILFLDNSGGSVSRIMRDMPAKKIQEMMDDL
jgi:mannose/fructose-specific phosphotransferase system component IIA